MLFTKDKKDGGGRKPLTLKLDDAAPSVVVSKADDDFSDGSGGLFIREPKDITPTREIEHEPGVEAGESTGLFIRKPVELPQTVPFTSVSEESSPREVPAELRDEPAPILGETRREPTLAPESDNESEGTPVHASAEAPEPSGLFVRPAQATSEERDAKTLQADKGNALKGLFKAKTKAGSATQPLDGGAEVKPKKEKRAGLFSRKPKEQSLPTAQTQPSGTLEAPLPEPELIEKKAGLFGKAKKAAEKKEKSDARVSEKAKETPMGPTKLQAFLAQAFPTFYKLPSPNQVVSAPKKRAPVSSKISGKLPIVVQLDGGEQVYYTLTKTKLTQVEAHELTKAASFSSDDRRFIAGPNTTYQQAVDIVLADGISEDVRVLNMAKSMRRVYGTSLERVNEAPLALGPGLLLIEKALVSAERPAAAHVICVLLKDDESARSLAIIYHSNPEGEIDAPQISVNPTNLAFTLAQFQAARGLPRDVQIVQLGNEDLMSVVSDFRLYPQEGMWKGIPLSRIFWGGVIVSGALAAGAAAYAGQTYFSLQAERANIIQLKDKAQRLDQRNEALIASSLVSYGKLQSIDIERVSERAGAIWLPRSIMRLESTAQTETYFLSMPLTGGGFFNNKPSALSKLQSKNVEQLLKLTPPDGCTKNMPGVSGGVNVIEITISCESSVGSASRYRLD